jgi:esterase/lipase superfamily enzyme
MPETLSEVVIPLLAGLFYGLVWYATRNLPRAARVLGRVLPILVLGPVVLLFSLHLSPQREDARRVEAARKDIASREAERVPARSSAPAPQSMPPPPPETARPGPEQLRKSVETRPATSGREAPAAPPAAPPSDAVGWDVVPVFYGTDRMRRPETTRVTYTVDRARRLELGQALVTVPKVHQVPSIERPFAIRIPFFQVAIYEQAEDPSQHFTIKELKSLTREQFLALARERIATSSAFKDQAVVFVHGYNTSFDYALYRTAQMAYDLRFDGGAFLYSWPSGGGVAAYGYDRESATQSEPYLRDFLNLVVRETNAKSVSVIAHSMGNLPLLNVLREIGPALPPTVRLNQIILAAPDVDRDVFANLAANIRQYSRGVTLYCSANDRAMSASRRYAGGIPRAGDVPPEGPIVISGIDTIDVTHLSTDVLSLNHSSYAEKSALLNDIGLLLLTGERPPERRAPVLQRVQAGAASFWRFP